MLGEDPKPVYTPEGLQRTALRLLVALGIDAAIFPAAFYLASESTEYKGIGSLVLVLSAVLGVAITLLLVLTVIAWILVAASRRG